MPPGNVAPIYQERMVDVEDEPSDGSTMEVLREAMTQLRLLHGEVDELRQEQVRAASAVSTQKPPEPGIASRDITR